MGDLITKDIIIKIPDTEDYDKIAKKIIKKAMREMEIYFTEEEEINKKEMKKRIKEKLKAVKGANGIVDEEPEPEEL